MIPIRDTLRSQNFPTVTYAIIAINCLVFLGEMLYPGDTRSLLIIYGFVPARYSIPDISSQFTNFEQIFSLVSFMFMHGSFLHLLGNMWFLYIFGDNVEDRLGPLKYSIFYFICGWASGFAHFSANMYSDMPTIGASGAIAGVMGAYLIICPKSKILTLIPILFIPYFVEIPSPFFLGFWVLFQLLSAAFSDVNSSGIAWWAHVGGFFFGMVLLKAFVLIPESGLSRSLRNSMQRDTTPHLHMTPCAQYGDDAADLCGTITLTPREVPAARKSC